MSSSRTETSLATAKLMLGAAFYINLSALLAALLFDRLPRPLDSIVVMGLPIVLGIATVPLIARAEGDQPGKLQPVRGVVVGAMLAALVAAIFPGMFTFRQYLQLSLGGTAIDVSPGQAAQAPVASFYRFTDARLRTDLRGVFRHREPMKNPMPGMATGEFWAVPLVDHGWQAGDRVSIWVIATREPSFEGQVLQGMRQRDRRGFFGRAVSNAEEHHDLLTSDEPVFVRLTEDYQTLRRKTGRITRLALAALTLSSMIGVLVFLRNAWR